MTDFLVTGIAPTSDPAQLESILEQCNCDKLRVSIITKATATAGRHEDHAMGAALSASSTIMTGSSGTGVPGMGRSASLSSFGGGGGGVPDYLGGLPLIPPDQAHNFNVAIAEGRSLVTYKADEDEAPTVQTAFRQAGLRNVKIFKA
jgi:hypothetical protein